MWQISIKIWSVDVITNLKCSSGTFYASPVIAFKSTYFQFAPLSSALPFIRRVNIRFSMLMWLYGVSIGFPRTQDPTIFLTNINQISKTLARAPCLQSLKLVWTETTNFQLETGDDSWKTANCYQPKIDDILQPLKTIKPSCAILKSDVMVKCWDSA